MPQAEKSGTQPLIPYCAEDVSSRAPFYPGLALSRRINAMEKPELYFLTHGLNVPEFPSRRILFLQKGLGIPEPSTLVEQNPTDRYGILRQQERYQVVERYLRILSDSAVSPENKQVVVSKEFEQYVITSSEEAIALPVCNRVISALAHADEQTRSFIQSSLTEFQALDLSHNFLENNLVKQINAYEEENIKKFENSKQVKRFINKHSDLVEPHAKVQKFEKAVSLLLDIVFDSQTDTRLQQFIRKNFSLFTDLLITKQNKFTLVPSWITVPIEHAQNILPYIQPEQEELLASYVIDTALISNENPVIQALDNHFSSGNSQLIQNINDLAYNARSLDSFYFLLSQRGNMLNNRETKLPPLLDFLSRMGMLVDTTQKPIIKTIAHAWIIKYCERNYDEHVLIDVENNINHIQNITISLSENTNISNGQRQVLLTYADSLLNSLKDEILDPEMNTKITLLKYAMYPTQHLIDFVSQYEGEEREAIGIKHLEHLRAETLNGNFVLKNFLQKDLEYGKYKELEQKYPEVSKPEFDEIKFTSSAEFKDLLDITIREAHISSFESALLFRMLALLNDPLLISNRSFSYTLTEPVQARLREVSDIPDLPLLHIPSTEQTDLFFKIFPIEYINNFVKANKQRPIVLVDQTREQRKVNKASKNERFPGSMKLFLDWFLAFNESHGFSSGQFNDYLNIIKKENNFQAMVKYITSLMGERGEPFIKAPYYIAFWRPGIEKTGAIDIGDFTEIPYAAPLLDPNAPQIILADPGINFKNHNELIPSGIEQSLRKSFGDHRPGYFDDIYRHKDNDRRIQYHFTEEGLVVHETKHNPEVFIQRVQSVISEKFPQMLELTKTIGNIL